jgi:hypothetical protein
MIDQSRLSNWPFVRDVLVDAFDIVFVLAVLVLAALH